MVTYIYPWSPGGCGDSCHHSPPPPSSLPWTARAKWLHFPLELPPAPLRHSGHQSAEPNENNSPASGKNNSLREICWKIISVASDTIITSVKLVDHGMIIAKLYFKGSLDVLHLISSLWDRMSPVLITTPPLSISQLTGEKIIWESFLSQRCC